MFVSTTMLFHVSSKGDTPIGYHFSSNGHNSSDMRFYGIEIVTGDVVILLHREKYWISKFNTLHDGLNENRAI